MSDLGRMLIVIGGVLLVVGVLMVVAERVPGLGRLPGDIYVRRGNWTFYFPIATSIVVSVVLTLIMYLLSRR